MEPRDPVVWVPTQRSLRSRELRGIPGWVATHPTWMTPADALASGHPKGMELWRVHVFGWLACIVVGTVIGLMRWGAKKDAEAEAAAAKAKPKAAGA